MEFVLPGQPLGMEWSFDLLGNQNCSITTEIVESWEPLSEQTLVLRHQGGAQEIVIDIRSGTIIDR
jgi:hypothetical protein